VTAVFVHGNPEVASIWGPLLDSLSRRDTVTLSPPGFGAPVPEGFGATSDDYLQWLVDELEGMGEPVDLVGHDWGGGHVVRVACGRPDLLRSWCTDIGGCFAPDYVWHDMAQTWQTPGAGEEAIAAMLAVPVANRARMYESVGMTPEVATAVAAGLDETMGRCILSLYRSAAQPALAMLGGRLPAAAARPGLVIIPTEDGYTGGEERARWSAAQAKADVAVLDGLGHWWMTQDPRRGAEVLERFWAFAVTDASPRLHP
jgi:pimeloyl-ACP methyl ester carboxylesterase